MNSCFGRKLKQLREERNVSISEIHKALGFSRSTIYEWESGKRYPSSFETLRLLARFLGVSPEYFKENAKDDELTTVKERLERIEKILKIKS